MTSDEPQPKVLSASKRAALAKATATAAQQRRATPRQDMYAPLGKQVTSYVKKAPKRGS